MTARHRPINKFQPLTGDSMPKIVNTCLEEMTFTCLSLSPTVLSRVKTALSCVSTERLKITIKTLDRQSSMETCKNLFPISRWKVAGALHRPNGITQN